MTDYKLVPVDTLKSIHRDLDACQNAIWRHGGFRPAYWRDAQARLKEIDELLAAPAVQGEPVGYVRPHQLEALRSGKACGITLEDKPDAHNRVTIPLYAAPQPAEQQLVRLPQRAKPQKDDSASIHGFCDGWNNCLDEVARLNGDRMANPEPDVAGLVGALEEIIHPVRFMQERLEEGERLNGMAAVQLAEDASYLRGIAIAALAAHRKQEDRP